MRRHQINHEDQEKSVIPPFRVRRGRRPFVVAAVRRDSLPDRRRSSEHGRNGLGIAPAPDDTGRDFDLRERSKAARAFRHEAGHNTRNGEAVARLQLVGPKTRASGWRGRILVYKTRRAGQAAATPAPKGETPGNGRRPQRRGLGLMIWNGGLAPAAQNKKTKNNERMNGNGKE